MSQLLKGAEETAKLFIEMFENPVYWEKPWEGTGNPFGMGDMPFNALSGRQYTAGNMLYLWAVARERGYQSSGWMTYAQKDKAGLRFKEGAKGQGILIPWFKRPDKVEGQVQDPNDPRNKAMLKWFMVWNCDHIDGVPEQQRAAPTAEWRHGECERLLTESGAKIFHDGGNQAYYKPKADTIHLPVKDAFKTPDGYYATALHELGHWSGHEDRLKRDQTGVFGTESYAKEELVAELSSFMMGERLGIGHDPRQHAAYAKHWCKILKDEPMEIFKAATKAEAVCRHLGIEAYQREPIQVKELEKVQGEQPVQDDRPRPKAGKRWSPKKKTKAKAPKQPTAAREPRKRARGMEMSV